MLIPAWDERQLFSSESDVDCHHHDEKNKKKLHNTSQTARVRFTDQDEVHEVLPLSQYTAEEVRNCWFSKTEYNSFKRNSLLTLSLNRAGELSPDDPEHTMRGLECRTRECTDSRRMMRYRTASAVFNEQARQKSAGVSSPKALSERYHSISWYSMYDAHTQGMADEQDALAFLAPEEKFVTSLVAPQAPCKGRNTVLSKIISIERSEPAATTSTSLSTTTTTNLIAGLDCGLFSSASNTAIHGTSTAFNMNVNSLFHDVSLGIAVAAA